MSISLSDPVTWVAVLVAPVVIVAARWALRRGGRGKDKPPPE